MKKKKTYDEKKILFVLREPQERVQEAAARLRALTLPHGFTAEVVTDAASPAAAYANAMQRRHHARYKVYLTQGAEILQRDFLLRMVSLFRKEPKVGVIGLVGTEQLPTSGLFWNAAVKRGNAVFRGGRRIEGQAFEGSHRDVMAVSSVLATQYDVPWREDLFREETFLAASVCAEQRRQGYRTVVLASQGVAVRLQDREVKVDAGEQARFLDTYSAELYPLVSVIIPTYERPEYFRVALTSVVQQTYRNLDIFVTDNSHDTRTKELYEKEFADDPRIHYEHHPEYDGAIANWQRARAYDNPKAQYVNWLMDDDVFLPEKIAKMMDFYFKYPDVMLVTSYRQLIDAQGNLLPDISVTAPIVPETARIRGEEMGRYMLTNLCNFIGEPTTALAKKAGMLDHHDLGWTGKEGRYCISDFPTWLRLLSQGDVVYIREPLSRFRRHPGQDQNQASTMASIVICWGFMIRAAIEQHVFLNEEEDRRRAFVSYVAMMGNFLKMVHGQPIWQEKYIGDLLAVYAATMETWANGKPFPIEIDTSV